MYTHFNQKLRAAANFRKSWELSGCSN